MAVIHPQAEITPTKLEVIQGWLPSRPWWDGEPREVTGAFRFDDPDGTVGMEGFLLGDEPALFVPLTYREAALPGAEEHLITTMEHTVLGTRWVYDACGDPVFVRALADAIVTGGSGVDQEFTDDAGASQVRPTTAQVRGSGSADTVVDRPAEVAPYDEGPVTLVNAGALELVVARVVGGGLEAAQTLTATWGGRSEVIAGVRPG